MYLKFTPTLLNVLNFACLNNYHSSKKLRELKCVSQICFLCTKNKIY